MDQSKIYVGNLSYQTSEDDLRDFFGKFGSIEHLTIIMDRETGRSKGFGFITYSSSQEANAALEVNGQDLDGRTLKVNIARDNRDGGGSRGGFGGDRRH